MEGHGISRDELARRFNHHPPPDSDTAQKHEEVRRVLREAAERLVELTGAPSPEQSLAVRDLEGAMMWFNADIARKGADAAAAHEL